MKLIHLIAVWCILFFGALAGFIYYAHRVPVHEYGYSDVFFVRPLGACQYNGNGRLYRCAPASGSDGAFVGLQNITWEPSRFVLYVCGQHHEGLSVPPIHHAILSGWCPWDRSVIY